MLPSGGGCFLPARGGGIPGGVLPSGGMPPSGGCFLPGGGWYPRGVLLSGGDASFLGEGVVSQHALRQTPPPVDRITDMSKNITLATTKLWPVTRMHSSRMRTVLSSAHLGGCVCPGESAQGVSAQEEGCLPGGGVSAQGALQRIVCILLECILDPPGQTPPTWTEFLTHTCENITFPQKKKAFQWGADRPTSNRTCFIMNKFEHVQG